VQSLGFGVHGSVSAARNSTGNVTAVKYSYEGEPFERELDVYWRLRELQIRSVNGFFVPELIDFDADLRVLQMTIVPRPFILDFAGAYLDFKPKFTEDIWQQWEERRREEYGARWSIVRGILDAFEEMDIYILDVHPSNIAFLD
jgi:hypothetical protein